MRDHDGRDVWRLRVELDGTPLPVGYWLEPIDINPGPHALRIVTEDHRSTEVRFFAKIAEKGREIVVRLPPPVTVPRSLEPTEVGLAGLGVLGLGMFVGFGLSGYSLQQDLEKCAPYCQNREQADRMRSRYLVADISLAIGLISLGTATYSYLKRVRSTPTAAANTELRGSNRHTGVVLPANY